MRVRIMKRVALLLLCISLILGLVACDFNAPLRKAMTEYYSQKDNYKELCGEILSTEYYESSDVLFLEIDLVENKYDFQINKSTGRFEFELNNWSTYDFSLKEGDFIEFISAPMHFYNGHTPPIVGLKLGDVEYISFDDGIRKYLSWVEEAFS